MRRGVIKGDEMTEYQKKRIRELWDLPRKPSKREILNIVNIESRKKGIPILSKDTVRRFILGVVCGYSAEIVDNYMANL